MKVAAATTLAILASCAGAFQSPFGITSRQSSTSLSMVLEKPMEKKLAKIETLKIDSDHLIHPLKEVRVVVKSFV